MNALWYANPSVADASRFARSLRATSAYAEAAVLVAMGILAAIATCALADFTPAGIRLPGHAILRGTLPLVLGISLVPRRTSGTAISLVAAAAFLVFRGLGVGLPNSAAITGILALGPAMDIVLKHARGGWMLYLQTALAGLSANLVAFAVRIGSNLMWAGGGGGGGGGILSFWPLALVSFVCFGILAGLVSGMICFRSEPNREPAVR